MKGDVNLGMVHAWIICFPEINNLPLRHLPLLFPPSIIVVVVVVLVLVVVVVLSRRPRPLPSFCSRADSVTVPVQTETDAQLVHTPIRTTNYDSSKSRRLADAPLSSIDSRL